MREAQVFEILLITSS